MKIIDGKPHIPVKKYSVGDVIQDDCSTYLIGRALSGYCVVDLDDGSVIGSYSSLDDLYTGTHEEDERKVDAFVIVSGEAE